MMDEDETYGDSYGLDYDLEVARGMKSEQISRRKAAENMWRAIAAGEADRAQMVCWVEHVAKEICSEILDNASLADRQRGSKALIATGLYGNDDMYREMRAFISMWLDFGELSQNEGGLEFQLKPPMIVRACRSKGFFAGVKDAAAVETARRQLKLVLKDRAQR
jgi:hypothetical protein